MVFADAFHPSASYSATDDENDNESTSSDKDQTTGNEVNNLPDAAQATCSNANEETVGRPHPDNDTLWLFHFDSTASTQDEAKTIAKRISETSATTPETFCVTATSQTSGRGTTGRKWLGAPGNVFLTIGIPVEAWMTKMLRERRIPLTLLPLKIGDLTASLIRNELDVCSAKDASVTVKWPNDVLVDSKKISGTLIENSSDWFLIGIGINIVHAPTISTTGADYGRPSVSLDDYCGDSTSKGSEVENDDADADRRGQKARDLGVRLALDFHRWMYQDSQDDPFTADSIVEGWKQWLDWDAELTMRNDRDETGPRRVVRLLDVLPDGRIRVANKGDGKEKILVSDYFV